eukprot:GHVT01076571.1.p1 GENE.GHVT01076571.1~~GHVT01076571.1.p1  ORF type:complete len:301 (-),score=65.04 GHVT01076571.1:69-971(-)
MSAGARMLDVPGNSISFAISLDEMLKTKMSKQAAKMEQDSENDAAVAETPEEKPAASFQASRSSPSAPMTPQPPAYHLAAGQQLTSFLGSMLFTRRCTGLRVVSSRDVTNLPPTKDNEIDNHAAAGEAADSQWRPLNETTPSSASSASMAANNASSFASPPSSSFVTSSSSTPPFSSPSCSYSSHAASSPLPPPPSSSSPTSLPSSSPSAARHGSCIFQNGRQPQPGLLRPGQTQIGPTTFTNFGAHCDNSPTKSYITGACAIGAKRGELEIFLKRLHEVFEAFTRATVPVVVPFHRARD